MCSYFCLTKLQHKNRRKVTFFIFRLCKCGKLLIQKEVQKAYLPIEFYPKAKEKEAKKPSILI